MAAARDCVPSGPAAGAHLTWLAVLKVLDEMTLMLSFFPLENTIESCVSLY